MRKLSKIVLGIVLALALSGCRQKVEAPPIVVEPVTLKLKSPAPERAVDPPRPPTASVPSPRPLPPKPVSQISLPKNVRAVNDNLILAGGRAGPVLLQAAASTVTEYWGAARQTRARQGKTFRWWEYPERGVWLLVEQGRVVRIGIESEAFLTPEGFGVGKRASPVEVAYGPGERRRATPWTEQEYARPVDVQFEPHQPPERFFLDYRERGICFLVDTAMDRIMAIHLFLSGTDPAGPPITGGENRDAPEAQN